MKEQGVCVYHGVFRSLMYKLHNVERMIERKIGEVEVGKTDTSRLIERKEGVKKEGRKECQCLIATGSEAWSA